MKLDLHHTAKFLAKTFGYVCDNIYVDKECAKRTPTTTPCDCTAYECWKDFLKRNCGEKHENS